MMWLGNALSSAIRYHIIGQEHTDNEEAVVVYRCPIYVVNTTTRSREQQEECNRTNEEEKVCVGATISPLHQVCWKHYFIACQVPM